MSEGKNKDMVRCGDLLITQFAVFDLSQIQEICLNGNRMGGKVFFLGYDIEEKQAFDIAEHWTDWKKEKSTGGAAPGVYSAAVNILESMQRDRLKKMREKHVTG